MHSRRTGAGMMAVAAVIALGTMGIGAPAPIADQRWVATWGTAQQAFRGPSVPAPATPPAPAAPGAGTSSQAAAASPPALAPASAGTLVTFGDSITDGDQSTPDTLGMWPAVLAARLQSDRATAGVGVVNAGISGNRVLGDNNSGLARLARDVLAVPGVRWMTLLEGINDITGATRAGQAGTTFTADTLIAAYRQMIQTAHGHAVMVIGCTLTPYGGSNVYTDQGEAIRQAVNRWIRSSGEFDGVCDFDAATRDPQDPSRFAAAVDSPDMLHPANPGYAMMARSVELSIFKARR